MSAPVKNLLLRFTSLEFNEYIFWRRQYSGLFNSSINNFEFKIEELWDSETDESIPCVNPGKLGQTVKLKLPIECQKDWILRRKKDK